MGSVLLVRHGQASFGAADYDVLSPAGWEQGRALGRHLAAAGVVPTALVRGALRRHAETLEAIAEGAGWSPDDVRVDAGWDEFDHTGLVAGSDAGSAAGSDRRAFQRLFEAATARWAAGDDDGFTESWTAFTTRVRGALDRAVAAAGPGRTVVVTTSGGPIGLAAAVLLDPEDPDPAGPARRWQRANTVLVNSSVTRLVVGGSGARLLTFNEHAHLDGAQVTYR